MALQFGLLFVGAFAVVLPGLLFVYTIYERPSLAPFIIFIAGYLNMGIGRYFSAPMGLVIDGLLGLSWLILLLKGATGKVAWR